MAFTKQEAQAFFAKLTVEADGLPPAAISDEARTNFAEAAASIGDFGKLTAFMAKVAKAGEAAGRSRASAEGITFKVGRKGAVSVYGLGMMPLSTVYAAGWRRLLAKSAEFLKWIDSNPVEFWPESPERTVRGRKIPAAPAVLVRLSTERGDDNILASGDAAIAEAKKRGIYREFNKVAEDTAD